MLRAQKKLIAIRRAERRLKTRLEDIDWELDVLKPEIEALTMEAAKYAELPQFTIEESDEV